MNKDMGASASRPGSRASTEPVATPVSAASGFDPSRGDPYPAFIRDNPIMQIAFRDFMHWIWAQEPAHEAFRGASGMPSLAKGLGGTIDVASGYMAAYAAAFTRWAVETQWGAEDYSDSDGSGEAGETGTGSAEGNSAGLEEASPK
jgi:hypothetical protein